jgi:hypothetical protein
MWVCFCPCPFIPPCFSSFQHLCDVEDARLLVTNHSAILVRESSVETETATHESEGLQKRGDVSKTGRNPPCTNSERKQI